MPHLDLFARIIFVSLLAIAALGACSSVPPSSLQQIRYSMISKLTTQCYWEHEGERFVFGPAPVWSACRRWANTAVNVRFANTAGDHRSGD